MVKSILNCEILLKMYYEFSICCYIIILDFKIHETYLICAIKKAQKSFQEIIKNIQRILTELTLFEFQALLTFVYLIVQMTSLIIVLLLRLLK